MKPIRLMLTGILVAVAAVFAVHAWAIHPESFMSQDNNYTLNQYDGNFDKETCEQNCRSLYGVTPYHRRGGGHGDNRGRYYVYAQCIQDCNTKFWKEFDRRTLELEE